MLQTQMSNVVHMVTLSHSVLACRWQHNRRGPASPTGAQRASTTGAAASPASGITFVDLGAEADDDEDTQEAVAAVVTAVEVRSAR